MTITTLTFSILLVLIYIDIVAISMYNAIIKQNLQCEVVLTRSVCNLMYNFKYQVIHLGKYLSVNLLSCVMIGSLLTMIEYGV
jgi:hypothetical protein